MSETRKPFPFSEFEPKWQSRWESEKTFRTPNPGDEGFDASKPKYYVLDMFPYPSGAGLHVGHPEGYTATDIIGRYKRMNGFNVLHPMGYDSFGLPAEQYAIKTGQHPAVTTAANIGNFRRQLKSLGFAYDWEREIATTDPGYVRWTQWIFLQIYNSYFCEETNKAKPVSELEAKGWSREQIDAVRLAYVADTPVWWSPDLGTVLANEEVEEWKGKGHTVERRPLRQWMLRITKYAQRLIDELDTLDWPTGIKLLQKNWIGRSEGASVKFQISNFNSQVEVFTTRPDTLFGATYMVLAPEHPFVVEITTDENKEAVEGYKKACSSKSDLDRTDLNKDKSGVFTGAFAVNPVNKEEIPIWIADYVMMGYGTGAIMAVPGHDGRDYEFATKFDLPVVQVVQPKDESEWQGFTGQGTAVNSGFLDGLSTWDAKTKMIAWLMENEKGERKIQFKLRDWLFSRQRYWGEPFPITWKGGEHFALPDSDLPLLAPPLEDYKPSGSPEPILSKAKDWVELEDGAIRETNTMPQWAGSCWYYLRYCDPSNSERFISKEVEDYWTSEKPGMVDLYVGGTEHAVLHLLYARFWHKVLFDLGHVGTPEPFQRLVNQGLIMGEDGQKMSKSRGNVVNPDDVVSEYGADSLRLYEMFMGPLEQVKPWQMKGVEGVSRFLARVWRLSITDEGEISPKIRDEECTDKELIRVVHETIKKVGEDIEKLSFNTAISQMMICTNAFTQTETVSLKEFVSFLSVLNPFAPHLTEEIHERLCVKFGKEAILLSETDWPKYDEKALIRTVGELVVQVNGKLRDRILMALDAPEETAKELALASEKIKEYTDGKTIRKIIYIPGKIMNLVAN
ncbi:MAG: leucine--tRNA ligase [Verrucomicrobia bacterium]|nr:leucine--tRNA ligase [Verrucomicrobiota bacterium]|tara:strand:+ start:30551 stop:33097 length:2547 start_codon:yes stop_codon:yes gene_type:complete